MEEMTTKREIGVITAEIITIREHTNRMVLENSIEIGRRLLEAKEVVGHGGWGEYLREQVNFSPSTANNLMAICKEYGDTQLELGKAPKSQTFGNLTYSQAVALLALPEVEREEVVETHDMETTSVRELQAIIEEKKREAAEAREEAEKARQAAEANRQLALKHQDEIKKRDLELKTTREELSKMESRPVEVAVKEPSEEELEQLRQDAEKAAEEKFEEQMRATLEELEETKMAEKEQAARAARLEKQLAVAGNSKMAEFNILLLQIQEDDKKLREKHLEIMGDDPEKAKKLKAGMVKMMQMMAEEWEE